MNKRIRFTIFNEDFWSKGLIYSQNLLPLIKLNTSKKFSGKIQIVAFVSFLDLLLFNRQIIEFKKEFYSEYKIKTRLYPILFVRSRFFILRWFMFPLLIITTLPYLILTSIMDVCFYNGRELVYHLRAYTTSFLFSKFYFGNARLIFDPRSDFIAENRSLGNWKLSSLTDKIWTKIEIDILSRCEKSIFISLPHLQDTLFRSKIDLDDNKHSVFPNPIDFTHFKKAFSIDRRDRPLRFLYTGSLGNWNNLETYLSFFKEVKKVNFEATMYVVTSTRESKLNRILNNEVFKEILNDVKFYHDVPYEGLSELYQECNVGLQLMDKEDSRIGVKYVEYLASGLIPVVSDNVRGAADYCLRKKLGLCVVKDNINYEALVNELLELQNNNLLKKLILKEQHVFDVNISYNKLFDIYG